MAELLAFLGIKDRATWHAWAKANHPDHGGDSERFARAKNAYDAHLAKLHGGTSSGPRASNPPAAAPYARWGPPPPPRAHPFPPPYPERRPRPRSLFCEAPCKSGGQCSKPKTAGTKFCSVHVLEHDPAGAARADAERQQQAVERALRAEERAAAAVKRKETRERAVADALLNRKAQRAAEAATKKGGTAPAPAPAPAPPSMSSEAEHAEILATVLRKRARECDGDVDSEMPPTCSTAT
jgi:hypothetical protein